MTRRPPNRRSNDILDPKDDAEPNEHWNSLSSNEESVFDPKSEVLWSRETNDAFSEKDFFRNLHDSYSDFTDESTSSCSWHNDDFDMNSSTKVKASLEAIEDALYEKHHSPLLNDSLFQECCDWSNKFPYFRLKGEQIIKPVDDSVVLYASSQENANRYFENPQNSLQVEGKKMAIHAPDKSLKKALNDDPPDDLHQTANFFEEVFDDDGEYEECYALDTRDSCNKVTDSNAKTNVTVIKSIQEKVIERLALEMWPKVLAVLDKVNQPQMQLNMHEDFQLPPIVSNVQQRQIPVRRPKTEGTDFSIVDFPKLDSILSISPKVLQNRKQYGNWKGSLRTSRPSSEIHLSRKTHIVSNFRSKKENMKVSCPIAQHNHSRQVQLIGTKMKIKEEKEPEPPTIFLPALEEDIPDSSDLLRGLNIAAEAEETKPSTCKYATLSRKPEGFLPPIDGKNIPSNVKLTRNLFTFFGAQIKCDNGRGTGSASHKPRTPASRPNTSTSRRTIKYSGSLKQNLLNDSHSSIKNSSALDIKKLSENLEKQVTLFPIVTSLVPNKEKGCSDIKKGLLDTFAGKKR